MTTQLASLRTTRPDAAPDEVSRALAVASAACAAFVVVVGLLVVLGWWVDEQSLRAIGPVDVVMNPLVALLFVLTGIALLIVSHRHSRACVAAAAAIAVVVATCGALVLLRSFGGWDSGVDAVLFADAIARSTPPDRMAENTAFGFLMLGLALLSLSLDRGTRRRVTHWLILPVALMALLVVIGYVYRTTGFITFQLELPMAANTALLFLAASLGVVSARGGAGVVLLIARDSAGGRIARRLLPPLLLTPLLLGAVINLGIRMGAFGAPVGLALLTLATIVLSTALTLVTAVAVERGDRALRRSEEHFRALIENASDAIIVVQPPGLIAYAAPSIERLLGYRPEVLIGAAPDALVHPDDLPRVVETMETIFRAPEVVHRLEFRIRHRDGGWRVFESYGRGLADGAAAGAAVINARDITEHKDTETALLHARDEAEKANRAKSDFLSRMSHELRTPMNSILGFAQLLALDELSDAQRRAVDRIRRAGDHLLMLINEVLDLARIEANRQTMSVEPVRISGVLHETIDLAGPIARQYGVTLITDMPRQADAFALADQQRLTQVLLNLVSNAIKYNRPGGSVRFLTRVEFDCGVPARVVIGVGDTGRGIPPDRIGDLFTPFARLGAEASSIEGTGLGLSLSRRFVEAMGGRIRVDSVVDVGSTFWVELPLAQSPVATTTLPADTAAALARESALASIGAATILYVEDNLANLDLIETLLAPFETIRLIPALQGNLGVELARDHRPDLVLLDLHLPDISGEAVLEALRSDDATRAIPVVIVSADATPTTIARLTAAGARAYVTKPLDVRDFLGTLEDVLRDRASAPVDGDSAARPLVVSSR